jgi:hypothetical protein
VKVLQGDEFRAVFVLYPVYSAVEGLCVLAGGCRGQVVVQRGRFSALLIQQGSTAGSGSYGRGQAKVK